MKTRIRALSGLLLLFTVLQASAYVVTAKTFTLPEHGEMTLQVPANWAVNVQQPKDALPPTITFAPQSGAAFEMLITPVWTFNKHPQLTSQELHTLAQKGLEQARPQAVEKDIPIREFRSVDGPGYYYSLTDSTVTAASPPGDFKYLTRGLMGLSGLTVTYTVLTQAANSEVVSQALGLLKTARYQPGAVSKAMSLAAPKANWVLSFPKDDWQLAPSAPRSNGVVYQMYTSDKFGPMSVFLDPTEDCTSATQCRALHLKTAADKTGPVENLEQFEINGFAVAKYTVNLGGAGVKQLNYSAHTYKDGYWVDVRQSKLNASKDEEQRMRQFLESLRFASQ